MAATPAPLRTAGPEQHHPREQVAAPPAGSQAGGERRGRRRALGAEKQAAPRDAGSGRRARMSGPPRGIWHARADGPRGLEAQRRGSQKEGVAERISALADK